MESNMYPELIFNPFGTQKSVVNIESDKVEEFGNDNTSHTDEANSVIRISICENATEVRDQAEDNEFSVSDASSHCKSSVVNQYPHKIEVRYCEQVGKNQKFFICKHPNCDKEFTKSWNLVYHARIHTKEKPFKCTECRESFAQKGNLKRHLKTHSETALCQRKKFQCSICLKKYTTKFNLKVHRETKHKEAL